MLQPMGALLPLQMPDPARKLSPLRNLGWTGALTGTQSFPQTSQLPTPQQCAEGQGGSGADSPEGLTLGASESLQLPGSPL